MEDREVDRVLFTTVARILITLAEVGGRTKISVIRRRTSSFVYPAAVTANRLGLVYYDPVKKDIELTPEGKVVAECLVRCLRVFKEVLMPEGIGSSECEEG